MTRSNSSFDFSPRPPETTREAVPRSGRSDLESSSETNSVRAGALGSFPSTICADPPSVSVPWKAVPRTVMSFVGSLDWTVRMALPA